MLQKISLLICKRWHIKQMQPISCISNKSQQGNCSDLYELNPTIKSFIKTKQFLKQGSNTNAAAWCIVKKSHTSEFNSKDRVMTMHMEIIKSQMFVPGRCNTIIWVKQYLEEVGMENYFMSTMPMAMGLEKLLWESLKCASIFLLQNIHFKSNMSYL